MELIKIDENLFKLIELMLKFSKMFHGDFKRQIMKQPRTKKTKVPFWTKRLAKNNNNTHETPSLDLALRAGKNGFVPRPEGVCSIHKISEGMMIRILCITLSDIEFTPCLWGVKNWKARIWGKWNWLALWGESLKNDYLRTQKGISIQEATRHQRNLYK